MVWLVTFAGLFLVMATVIGTILFLHSRKLLREQKNYERGLKTVPLLIHLPPPSQDIEVGQRDTRDVANETISKAETLYEIISSTVKKGFKSKFYGQRHFSFEIVGSGGFIYFYAAVPVALVDVVQQAIVSAYPAVRLEEVAEKNIFSPVGKINGTMGGELTLKENSAYPISTYLELKRDTMGALLNALSTLDKEDGAGIQILLRPADSQWRKNAHAVASKKRKGKEKKKGGELAFWWLKQVFIAPVKPPEDRSEKKKEEEGPSAVDQSLAEAIEDKAKHPGYEVLVRVIASSNISQRAQAIVNNIVATFSLFDAPGKNGFKYTPAKDIDSFVTGYILRFFPPENNKSILNSVELATLFHFPDQSGMPTSQLERQSSKQVDGPRNISDEGLVVGYNIFRGAKKRINLDPDDRRRHVYIVGQTGTGKSTMLENLALQDMLNGDGLAFIDPHGDTAERLLSMVPKERTEDVIYFSPADMEYPLGLNLFEFDSPQQKDFLIQEAINMLYKLYDPLHQGIIGPRYEHWFRNAALTIMSDPAGATFIDIPKVFTDSKYAKQKLQYVTDRTVLDFWNKEMASTSDYHKSEVLGWFVSKFGAFLSNEMMRNIIGQTKSAFNLREIMDSGKILLVNLSKGRTGELNSKLLGMIFVMKFQAAAMSRASVPEEERKDFSLYVDEFQNFSTDSFATILSEARKYHLNLIVANQFTTQLSDEIRDAVFGNVGTILSFRVGTTDAEFLAKYFAPVFDMNDLQRLPNWNTIARLMVGGVPSQPFSLSGLPPLGTANKQLAEALKQLSAAKFGRPRAKVEAEIFERLKTIEDTARPASGPPGSANYRPGSPGSPMGSASRPPSSGSSFLDDWLSKRQTGAFKPPTSPFGNSQQQPQAMRPATMAGQATAPIAASGAASPLTSPLPTDQPKIHHVSSASSPTPAPAPAPPPLQPVVAEQTPAPVNDTEGVVHLRPKTQASSQNISSNQIDKQEVSNIADELKQSINSGNDQNS